MATEKTPVKQFLTIQELASEWNISVPFIRRSIWAGALGSVRFGRVIRIARDEANRFISSHTEGVI